MAGTRPTPDFEIRAHPNAPLFSNKEDAREVLNQVFTTAQSGNFSTSNAEIREYLRQAGLVSLWFFLKVIAGYSGPYERLNADLSLDMCNFRQSSKCMGVGARAAMFVPRSTYKSTIFTHGAASWEALRNPELRMVIVNATAGRAKDFKMIAQRTFDTNAFFAWLYPEAVGKKAKGRWNEDDMVVPTRSRYFKEPTIGALGVGAAGEGDHYDAMILDDLIGLEDLDSNSQAAAGMEHAKAWYDTNSHALLVSPAKSRILAVATRYAIDDVYEIMMKNAKEFIGYKDPSFNTSPNGKFSIYYRLALEVNPETLEEEPIFPEELSKEVLDDIAQNDMWTFMTQYQNLPQKAGLAEFYQHEVKYATLHFDERSDRWLIVKNENRAGDPDGGAITLSSCDVVMAIDPAGTEKGVTAKTSRSSIGIWAMDSRENVYRIWEKVGHLSVEDLFDAIFEGHKLLGGHIRTTIVESNAMQAIIAPLLRQEELRRNQYINPQPIPAKGDKVARIRNTLGLPLSHGKVFLCEGCRVNFQQEKDAFPLSTYKMDVLDESEKAISALKPPGKTEELLEEEFEEEEMMMGISNEVFGY